jgi:GDP-4-dehydro-6-deoxy-D-mannose reductase
VRTVGRKLPVLVTGAAGFGGSHLVEHLLAEQASVVTLDHPAAPTGNLAAVLDRVDHVVCDLADRGGGERVAALLDGRDFAAVYHLAGFASVRRSWDEVRRTLDVNAFATLNLFGALRRQSPPPPVLLVGSAEEYGASPPEDGVFAEGAPLAPSNPYALSKVWQEELGAYIQRTERWPVHFTRTFNHTGPRQSPDFVCSDFARQIARIEFRLQEPVIRVGNLSASRDFLDVRDVAAAYRLIVERGRPGVPYNVCSGTPRAISDLLRILLGHAVLKIRVEVDVSRRRPVDVPVLAGDPDRLVADTGWAPRRPLEDTLRDLLSHWRELAAAEASAGSLRRPPREPG